jgi:tetratricopeptide (TPR) repeat protein
MVIKTSSTCFSVVNLRIFLTDIQKDIAIMDKEQIEALFALANLSDIQGDYETSETALQQLVSVLPSGHYATAKLAIAQYKNGKEPKAWESVHQLIKDYPKEPFGYYALGCLCFFRGDKQEAISNLERAHNLWPNDTVQLEIAPLLAELKEDPAILARQYSRMKNFKGLDEAEQRLLDSLPVRYRLLRIITDKAGSYEEAVHLYESLKQDKWRDALFYKVRGILLSKAGKLGEGILDLSQAISMSRVNGNVDLLYEALIERGALYYRSSELEQANIDFTEAIQLCPDRYLAYQRRGKTRMLLKRFAEAVNDFEKAFEIAITKGELAPFLAADLTSSITNLKLELLKTNGAERKADEISTVLKSGISRLKELAKHSPKDARIRALALALEVRDANGPTKANLLKRIRTLYKDSPYEPVIVMCYFSIASAAQADPEELQMLDRRRRELVPALNRATPHVSPETPSNAKDTSYSEPGKGHQVSEQVSSYSDAEKKIRWTRKKQELADEIESLYRKDPDRYRSRRQAFKVLFQNYDFPDEEYYKGFTWIKCYDLTMER